MESNNLTGIISKKDKPFKADRSHPWHSFDIGPGGPDIVNAFICITPQYHINYKLDKKSGFN